jgi:hypothetical protein
MRFRNAIGATALAAVALLMTIGTAAALDDSKYPDLKGQWRTTNRGLIAGGAGGFRWDESKPPSTAPNLGQDPPLTPEYKKIYEANLADMVQGGKAAKALTRPTNAFPRACRAS